MYGSGVSSMMGLWACLGSVSRTRGSVRVARKRGAETPLTGDGKDRARRGAYLTTLSLGGGRGGISLFWVPARSEA